MNPSPVRRGPLLLASFFLFAFASSLSAREVLMPRDEPMFRFVVPDEWQVFQGGPHGVSFMSADGYNLEVSRASHVGTREDALGELAERADTVLAFEGYDKAKAGAVASSVNPHGVDILQSTIVDGAESAEMVITNGIIEFGDGRYYRIVAAGTKDMVSAEAGNYEAFLASIERLGTIGK